MDRKEFLKICGFSCLGLLGASSILQSCGSTHYASSVVRNNQVVISKKEFELIKDNIVKQRKYIACKAEGIDYPIVIYKNEKENYTALLLRCTHQGAELTINGDMLSCSAHGSEFDKSGEVVQGPAEKKLYKFKVQSDEQNIYIQIS